MRVSYYGLFILSWLRLTSAMAGESALPGGCDHLLFPPDNATVTILEPATLPGLGPGDVVCLSAGLYHQILVRNLEGQEGQAIQIRNFGGRVVISNEAHYGISVRHASHLQIRGDGDPDTPFGIAILATNGDGVSFDQLSTHVSLSFTEIANTGMAGVKAKTDPDCSFASLRDQFTMYQTFIHDNVISDTTDEGIYIGSSSYTGHMIHCNGTDTLVYSHVLEGVKVFNNLVKRTGKNGIQVSSAVSDCAIYDNRVLFDSQLEIHNQMGGILIGGGSSCDCYNNHIAHGKGSAIEVFGRGNMMVFNNLIEYPGRTYMPDLPHFLFPRHGIDVQDIYTDSDARIHIFHNTIIYPKTDGIRYGNTMLEGSRVQNNIIVAPGSYLQIGNASFVHHPGLALQISNNIRSLSLEAVRFRDAWGGDYRLTALSPAVDSGVDLSYFGIDFDIAYANRPMGAGFDPGVFEYDPDSGHSLEHSMTAYPNPFSEQLHIRYYLATADQVFIQLADLTGRVYLRKNIGFQQMGRHAAQIDAGDLPRQGLYILTLTSSQGLLRMPLLHIR